MNYSRVFPFVLVLLVVNQAPAGSHHAFSPVYDAKKTITVDGVVTEFRFVNPHAMMLMEVKDKTGKAVTWQQLEQSEFAYLPKPEDCREDMEPPVKPGPDGIYPVFVPGETRLL